jgi:hypothetical protein
MVMLDLAAALVVLTGFAHSYLGEKYILMRLARQPERLPRLAGSPEVMLRTLRFAWHITTVAWLGFAALLLHMAQAELSSRDAAWVIAATFGVSGLVSLVASRGRHLSWVAFLAIAALAWAAVLA